MQSNTITGVVYNNKYIVLDVINLIFHVLLGGYDVTNL